MYSRFINDEGHPVTLTDASGKVEARVGDPVAMVISLPPGTDEVTARRVLSGMRVKIPTFPTLDEAPDPALYEAGRKIVVERVADEEVEKWADLPDAKEQEGRTFRVRTPTLGLFSGVYIAQAGKYVQVKTKAEAESALPGVYVHDGADWILLPSSETGEEAP